MNASKKDDFSKIRQKAYLLNKRRGKYIFRLLHGKPMIHGLPHKVFRRCGKTNCKCAQGQLHGPYPALSVNKDGKQRIVMIKKADALIIWEEASRYRSYQETLAKIRWINKEINELLEGVKTANTRSYP